MLSAGRGGLEQAFLDHVEALTLEGHRVMPVMHPAWPMRTGLEELGLEPEAVRSFGEWDPAAILRFRGLIAALRPDVLVTLGRRASALCRRANAAALPQAAITPNYSFKHLIGLDHVFAITGDVRCALIEAGQPAERTTVVPNMVRVPADAAPVAATPVGRPVIGALGRFVEKKGFHDLIDALAILHQRGRRFSAILAGDGPTAGALRAQAASAGLDGTVSFPGWISDKTAFFRSLDVFCVPSLHEPFGIVVLEGFAHARATVLSDAEGPREIATDGHDALMVPRGDPLVLADGLERLLADPQLRHQLGAGALQTARSRYDLGVVGRRLSVALREVVQRHARERALHASADRFDGPGSRC